MSEIVTNNYAKAPNARMETSALDNLRASKAKQTALEGMFVEFNSQDDGMSSCVVMYEGKYRVTIPISEMDINLTNTRFTDIDDNIRKEQICQTMLGAPVYFVVTSIDDSNKEDIAIIGSQRLGNEVRINRYFFEKKLIKEGTEIETKVVTISKDGTSLRLDVFGKNIAMKRKDLSHKWVIDLHDSFTVGDTLFAQVTELNLDEENQTVKDIKIDVKKYMDDMALSALQHMKIGSRGTGVITALPSQKPDGKKHPFYIQMDNGAKMLSYVDNTDIPLCVGDHVCVAVNGISKETELCFGVITSLLGHAAQYK